MISDGVAETRRNGRETITTYSADSAGRCSHHIDIMMQWNRGSFDTKDYPVLSLPLMLTPALALLLHPSETIVQSCYASPGTQ